MLALLEVTKALHVDNKLRNLLQDLDACGGRAVAALLRRAADGIKVSRHGDMSAEMCRDACWEKLHTGNWAEVSVMWRDAYTAASLLCACATAAAAVHMAATAQHEAPAAQQSAKALASAAVARHAACVIEPAAQTACQPPGEAAAAVPAAAAAAKPTASPSRAHRSTTSHGAPCGREAPTAAGKCGAANAGSAPGAAADGPGTAAGEFGGEAGGSKVKPQMPGAAEEALRQLDMAALLGGPLFRPLLDACIAALQTDIDSAAVAAAAVHPADGEPGSKRRRLSGFAASTAQAGCRNQPDDAAAQAGRVWVAVPVAPEVPLPPGGLQSCLVQRQPLPSLESFFEDFMCAADGGRPVIITGGIEHWPALQRWGDLSYLRTAAGSRTVPVEVGQHYLADKWGQQLMTLSEFIDRHILISGADSGADSSSEEGRGYLAQHELFEQIPALRADIREPEYCSLGAGGRTTVNAWFGPAGTVTPLHTDPYHNLLTQVVGRKYVRLYRHDATAGLYAFDRGFTTNCSQVDMDAPDAERFPLFGSLQHYDCVLEPGEMLYIPPKWWHYVKSLSVSFSVSFWWSYAGISW